MTGFGASAPAAVLLERFGITADADVNAVKHRLEKADDTRKAAAEFRAFVPSQAG